MTHTCLTNRNDEISRNDQGDRTTDHFRYWSASRLPEPIRHCLRAIPLQSDYLKSKRENEFEIGRDCAHSLLQTWGESAAVSVAQDRSPIWPKGYVGSISHSDHWAWSAVAQSESTRSIGIDTESVVNSQTRTSLEKEIASPNDWFIAAALGFDPEITFTIVFSAKEAFYKCWYPITGEFFGFDQVSVESCDEHRITIRTLKHNPNFGTRPETLDVYFAIIEDQVFTATWIGAE